MASHASHPGRAALGVFVLAAALAAGCSGNRRVTVEGTVTYKGTPVPAGYLVKFHGPGDHLEVGIIDEGGAYAVTDIPPGEVKVTVEDDPGMPATGTKSAGKAAGGKVAVPRKYMDADTSGLTFTITPGTRRLDLKLE
jgi:hypothetical protein